MFSVGDKLVHPLHGVGEIMAITEEYIGGRTACYYVFSLPAVGMTLKIPTDNWVAVGVRTPVPPERMWELFEKIPHLAVEVSDSWNRRYRENMEKLKSGNLEEVARVLKSLLLRENHCRLSTGERKMLSSAKRILLSEVVLVFNMSYEAAEELLQRAVLES